ncbi:MULTISPECIES: hypothetical protein [Rubrivivax]|uniref:Uncharacterized protein n=1 Tax=Rubrivivax benzoatilyticus TaxID=316997 RepID=A0ABX0HQP8_9BURK|nr:MULTISPECIES: hypothetical protein [Rubrivivax]MCC9595794.1 hypothetical protein [Rubrivivax sp. JA1055]MCC9647866.1 hypothetical protein [Rubrivivax sp. JA1029]NHK97387.1 hypothetical protein [Rubrivivax benzoatilyticus]NHL22918.1 hypothetical protein [Rubrivivax benzoatilyticus]
MRIPAALAAVVAGYLSMQLLIFSAGWLARVPAPDGWFAFFGPGRQDMAAGLLSSVAFALPQLLLAVVLGWAATRLFAVDGRRHAPGLVLGVLLPLLIPAVSTALDAPGGGFGASMARQLGAYVPPSAWLIPAGPWSALLGLAIGFGWLRRAAPRPR